MARRFRALHVHTGRCDRWCWWGTPTENWQVVVRNGIGYTYCEFWWDSDAQDYVVQDPEDFV